MVMMMMMEVMMSMPVGLSREQLADTQPLPPPLIAVAGCSFLISSLSDYIYLSSGWMITFT
jgi:hypothetical protein